MEKPELLKDSRNVRTKTFYEQTAKQLLDNPELLEDDFLKLQGAVLRKEQPDRPVCKGLKGTSNTETRIIKCMYFSNAEIVTSLCDKCNFNKRQTDGYNCKVVGDYKIIDYQYVVAYKGVRIGNIDLVLADEDYIYLTEVKPYRKSNPENLLRMFLETETYYRVAIIGAHFKDKQPRKAILFFKDSPQYYDFINERIAVNTKKLISKYDVTVFCAEIKDGEIKITTM